MLAREKYREASYSYIQMSKLSDDPEVFKHNLSAFLSAFRSVTFYLQKEFENDPRFVPWYEEKQTEMREDSVLRLLNKQQRLTVHIGTPRIVGKFTVYIADSMTVMPEAVQVLLKALLMDQLSPALNHRTFPESLSKAGTWQELSDESSLTDMKSRTFLRSR